MFRDEFKSRYTTIPFAICREDSRGEKKEVISHQHREIEVIAMTEGNADFYINTVHRSLKKGDVLLIPPFSIHRIEVSAGAPASYNCICFDLSLLWDEEIRTGLTNHTLVISGAVDGKEPYAAKMQEWVERGCLACENACPGWELEAIGSMSMLLGAIKKHGYIISDLNGDAKTDFAQRVLNYISENFHEPITSASAADSLYMNNSYFCRSFKKAFGSCFSNYILAYRLEKAKAYLNDTRSKITEISFKVGFNSCSYFTKTFKERFGMTPFAYRNGER